jgi:hypothetical protein
LFASSVSAPLLAELQLSGIGTLTNSAILHNRSTESGTSQIELESVSSGIQKIGFGEVSNATRLLQIGLSQVSAEERRSDQYASAQVSPVQIGVLKASTSQVGGIHPNVIQLSFIEASSNQVAIQGRTSQNGIAQVSTSQTTFFQTSSSQIGSLQFTSDQQSKTKISIGQINVSESSSNQIDIPEINPTEIPLTSSITLQQFLSSHNFSLQNITIPTWTEFLTGTTPFNLNIEITHLPTG